ncbi:MAG: hypothetical protein JWN14_4619 [Chthonomonadales bacterium]|nr:hypothetical protein [Chthonomonadales bacterium]
MTLIASTPKLASATTGSLPIRVEGTLNPA